jgi:hypothetical protein
MAKIGINNFYKKLPVRFLKLRKKAQRLNSKKEPEKD